MKYIKITKVVKNASFSHDIGEILEVQKISLTGCAVFAGGYTIAPQHFEIISNERIIQVLLTQTYQLRGQVKMLVEREVRRYTNTTGDTYDQFREVVE